MGKITPLQLRGFVLYTEWGSILYRLSSEDCGTGYKANVVMEGYLTIIGVKVFSKFQLWPSFKSCTSFIPVFPSLFFNLLFSFFYCLFELFLPPLYFPFFSFGFSSFLFNDLSESRKQDSLRVSVGTETLEVWVGREVDTEVSDPLKKKSNSMDDRLRFSTLHGC